MAALLCVVVVIVIATLVGFSVFVENVRAESTRSNLQQLAMALELYQDEYRTFPAGGKTSVESLWLLYPKLLADSRVYFNPRDRTRVPKDEGSLDRELTGFDYVGDCRTEFPKDIQVFERAATSGGRYVLRVDGTIQWMDESEFQRAVQEQAENRVKAPALPAFEVRPLTPERKEAP